MRPWIALTDLIVIAAALFVAQAFSLGTDLGQVADRPRILVVSSLVGLILGGLWFGALTLPSTRSRRLVGAGNEEYLRVVDATVGTFGIVAVVSYLADIELSRGYFVVALPIGLALLLAGRLAWRIRIGKLRETGEAMTGTVVVGAGAPVISAVSLLARTPNAGYVARTVAVTDSAAPDVANLLPDLDHCDAGALRAVVRRGDIDAVLVAEGVSPEKIKRLAWDLEGTRCELLLVSQLTDVAGPRIHHSPVDGLPVVHVDLPRYSGFAHVIKRTMDVLISGLLLVLGAPVFGIVALAVKLEDRGPVFFRQERVGRDGTTFVMHKFRSMSVDAEAHRVALGAGDGNGVLFKLRDDPRVTTVGRLLRRWSLDELPQLWDILRGAMSVVGPRPPLPAEVLSYEPHVHRRLLTRPGLTGPWQVSGRSDLSWDETVRLDLSYVENWSVTGDLVLLLRTVRAVLTGRGAY